MAGPLGTLLARFAGSWLGHRPGLVVMPVPLHPGKLRERGFNQSLLLARHVSQGIGTDLDFSSLRRVRFTEPQTGLKRKERGRNVRGAFAVKDPARVTDRPVLLVDDVATTGSTMNECARVLKRAGCREILCLVLARTALP